MYLFNWGSGTLACSIGLKIRCCRQQYGSPVRPDHKRAVNRVGDAEVLAEDGHVWGRHRRDKELVGMFKGSWGGVLSVGRVSVGGCWGLMSQVAQDEIQTVLTLSAAWSCAAVAAGWRGTRCYGM